MLVGAIGGLGLIGQSIPSPSQGVWWLGPVPLRAYGILMVSAMVLAVWVTYRRYVARGGVGDVVLDASLWAIPFGIVGGRLYHVITTPASYKDDLWAVARIWEGGMAIWGAVALGTVGAVIGLRRAGQRVGPFGDSLAPGLLLAQVLGRWGNYFNQELFGGPTEAPWGLEIDAAHLPAGYAEGTLFHPTFLYEGLWNLVMAGLIVWLDRKIRFKSGQVMALYLIAYGTGRFLMEFVRIDEARAYMGLRLNAWTALGGIVLGIIVFFIAKKIGAPTRILPEEKAAYLALTKDGSSSPEAHEAEKEAAEAVEAAEEVSREQEDSGEEAGARPELRSPTALPESRDNGVEAPGD